MWIFRTFCKYVFFAVTLLFSSAKCSGSVDEFELKIGLDKINFLIEEIFTRWDIQEYPLFLRSSTTTEIGWDIFKVRVDLINLHIKTLLTQLPLTF